jgi:hypothetical protein
MIELAVWAKPGRIKCVMIIPLCAVAVLICGGFFFFFFFFFPSLAKVST